MRTRTIASALATAALFALAACNKGGGSEGAATSDNPTTTQAAAESTPSSADQGGGEMGAKQAREMFTSRCATCHGPDGRGNGPGAVALNPKPRNYHDTAWQQKVTDEDIKKTITYGGAAVGKSPMMPASPDLDGKPQVVDGLVKIIREFGKS
jgi:mono/diheme cytochrome c family protein